MSHSVQVSRSLLKAAAAATALLAGAASAQTLPPPAGVLNLTTTATAEVPNDLMSVTFTVTRDGGDAQSVQTQVKAALETALAEARRAAKPGQVDVQTGQFSLQPRYGRNGTSIAGWQGSAELQVSGRDMTAIAQLAGRISSMTIARVGYGLSREAREKVEAEVSAQAIASFRARAAAQAKLFGYADYTIREVNVSSDQQPIGAVPMLRRGVEAMAADAAPLPTEAGRGLVSASVSGSVQMK